MARLYLQERIFGFKFDWLLNVEHSLNLRCESLFKRLNKAIDY
jgi:hypothetical protein